MIKYELVNFCEFDKYATQSYCAIHNVDQSLNLGDITKVNEKEIADFNMMVGGSPCQDFSVAGKQEGAKWTCKDCGHEYNPLEAHYTTRDKCPKCNSTNIEKTRSSLLVEWLRILREKKPNLAIYENVKNIVGKKFKPTFDLFIQELHEYGYNTYFNVLNSKLYGIPQNRERIYLIIIKKDLDNGKFKFPKEFDSGIRLKNILEDDVDSKYYLSERAINGITNSQFIQKQKQIQDKEGICSTLLARDYKDPKCIIETNKLKQIGYIGNTNSQGNRVYDVNHISTTLVGNAGGLGGKTGLYLEPDGFVEKKYNEFIEENGYMPEMFNPYNKTEITEYAPTQTANANNACSSAAVLINKNDRIRKLTPLECFRLMGFSDEDFYKAKNTKMSDTQLYKQAGNSIVVDVLYYILLELYKTMPYLLKEIKLSSFFSGIGAFEKAIDRLVSKINSNYEELENVINL